MAFKRKHFLILCRFMSAENNGQMNFMQHLEELRWRLVRCAIAILIFASVIWWYQGWVMDTLFMSMKDADFVTFRMMCKYFNICVGDIPIKMQSNTMVGQFSYALWMSILGGFVLAFPYIFYQLWSFVKPGLKAKEVKAVKGMVFYVSILFSLGILFGYFIVAPLSVQFFGSYQISKDIVNFFTINNYLSTILSTVLYSGLFFLLPVILYILTKLGVITSAFLRKYRKHAIIVVLALAAVITPPDVVSQIIVAIPIILLYELGIFVAARAERELEAKN